MSDPRLFAAACFAAAVLTLFASHVALCRLLLSVRRDMSRQKATALLGLAVNVPLVVVVLSAGAAARWPATETAWLAAYLLLAYNAAAYAYFHLFNLGETGRRIRMLLEVAEGGGDGSRESYSAEAMVRQRLERLRQMGQAREHQGHWRLEGRLLLNIGKFVHAVGVAAAGRRHR